MLLYEPVDNRKINISYSLDDISNSSTRLQTGITDNFATISLAKLIGGGINSIHELNAAEQCLRSIIFHETVLRQSPCVTVNNCSLELEIEKAPIQLSDYLGTNIFKNYIGNINNLQGFVNEQQAKEEISRREYKKKLRDDFNKKNGIPEGSLSFFSESCSLEYIADNLTDYTRKCFSSDINLQSRYILPIAQTKLSSYISYPFLLKKFEGRPLNRENIFQAKEFFSTIDDVWKKYSEKLNFKIDFSTPLFLNIVLSRASNRDDIGRVILELRDEYSNARIELWRHFDNADKSDFKESKDILLDIEDSTKRIFNESLMSSSRSKLVCSLDNSKRFFSILSAGAVLFTFADNSTAVTIIALINAYLNSFTIGKSMNLSAAHLTTRHIEKMNNEKILDKFFTYEELKDIEYSLKNYQ
ncbi:hypothetical protein [Photobacterium leiognathi]|uniref:hypothetical protein n=1 Tax=Photobacterium leiognathi TaxID=553611 RepID=UPI0029827B03|nr:hypothetical protein [Photobacterium leiognathi]